MTNTTRKGRKRGHWSLVSCVVFLAASFFYQ